ncbi:hypothetical protein DL95DRAFT_397044 [Leptodontidium sp. 2 PMI_412]|nr:hypothetical protein DL95DRAFT_397044 [Leptodontidium sp. 2 PMI_412]
MWNNYDIQVPCHDAGLAAYQLFLKCMHDDTWAYGQYFDTQKWNVIVRKEKC